MEEKSGTSLSRDVETYLLGIEKDAEDTMRQEEWLSDVREEEPHIMALTKISCGASQRQTFGVGPSADDESS